MMVNRLWKSIEDATRGCTIAEQTVAGLPGQALPQQEDRIEDWQQAWDGVTGMHLEGEGPHRD